MDPGEPGGWIPAYHDSPMAPNCLSHPLDPTSEALFPRLEGAIRLLIKDEKVFWSLVLQKGSEHSFLNEIDFSSSIDAPRVQKTFSLYKTLIFSLPEGVEGHYILGNIYYLLRVVKNLHQF